MAVVFDAANEDTGSGSSQYTLAHTVTSSGSNRYLKVGVITAAPSVSGIDFEGDSLTKLGGIADIGSSNDDLEWWYLLSPSVGAGTITINLSDTDSAAFGSESWTGVDQNNPHGTVQTTDQDGGTSISVDVTSQEGEVVSDLAGLPSATGETPGGGQTLRISQGSFGLFSSSEGGAASVTMSWTYSGSGGKGLIAVPLRAASGGRQLSTRYHINTGVNRVAGRTVVLDTLGRDVPLEQIKTDEWTHMGGAFFPTTRRFENLIRDRSRGYNESVSTRDVNTPSPRSRLAVRKESQLDFIMRRLTRGSV